MLKCSHCLAGVHRRCMRKWQTVATSGGWISCPSSKESMSLTTSRLYCVEIVSPGTPATGLNIWTMNSSCSRVYDASAAAIIIEGKSLNEHFIELALPLGRKGGDGGFRREGATELPDQPESHATMRRGRPARRHVRGGGLAAQHPVPTSRPMGYGVTPPLKRGGALCEFKDYITDRSHIKHVRGSS